MRNMFVLLLLVGIAAGTAHAEGPATPQAHSDQPASKWHPSPQACHAALSQAKALISAFQVRFLSVSKFRTLGDAATVSLYASNLKSEADSARHLTDRLFACSIVEGQSKDEKASTLADDFSTFATALSDITEFGNMYNWSPPDDDAFPPDLPSVARACGPILGSQLPQRIEKSLGPNHPAPSNAEMQKLAGEANPSEGQGLTACAEQAYKAGYVGAAWRLLTDAGLLQAAELVSSANQDLSLIKALGAARSQTIQIQEGPRSCIGTVENWGFEKTIAWNCL